MGVAGFSTLMICQTQLPTLKRKYNAKGPMLKDELLSPAVDDPDDKGYMPKVTPEMAHRAIDAADQWVRRTIDLQGSIQGHAQGQLLPLRLRTCGGPPQSARPQKRSRQKRRVVHHRREFPGKSQKPDGSWNCGAHWSNIADTSFALLFLGKTMEKKLKKIEIDILQRSLAIGGSGGLPTADGSSGGSAFQRQYERYKTQPTSSIDELVKILEDPDKIVEDETTAQVEQLTADQLKELVQKVGGRFAKASAMGVRQTAGSPQGGAHRARQRRATHAMCRFCSTPLMKRTQASTPPPVRDYATSPGTSKSSDSPTPTSGRRTNSKSASSAYENGSRA